MVSIVSFLIKTTEIYGRQVKYFDFAKFDAIDIKSLFKYGHNGLYIKQQSSFVLLCKTRELCIPPQNQRHRWNQRISGSVQVSLFSSYVFTRFNGFNGNTHLFTF